MNKITIFIIKTLAVATMFVGGVMGTGNGKLPIEEFPSSMLLSYAILIIGFLIFKLPNVLKHKLPELRHPLIKEGTK